MDTEGTISYPLDFRAASKVDDRVGTFFLGVIDFFNLDTSFLTEDASFFNAAVFRILLVFSVFIIFTSITGSYILVIVD